VKTVSKKRIRAYWAQDQRCTWCDCFVWEATLETIIAFEARIGRVIRRPDRIRCTAEHLLPRSLGGTDTQANIHAACAFCNQMRDALPCGRWPDDYRAHVRLAVARRKWNPQAPRPATEPRRVAIMMSLQRAYAEGRVLRPQNIVAAEVARPEDAHP